MQVRTVKMDGGKKYPVRSVVLVQHGEDGSFTRTELSEPKRKSRVTKRWRWLDKALRRINSAQKTASSEYLARHERSNQKKKNGAIRNLGKNLMRAQRKGSKKLKLRFL